MITTTENGFTVRRHENGTVEKLSPASLKTLLERPVSPKHISSTMNNGTLKQRQKATTARLKAEMGAV